MLTLSAGDASLVVAPEIGGAIVGWTFGAVPLLRRPLPEAILQRSARGLACFPLVPFCNRIAHGRFRWAGQDHTLHRNFGDHPHTIHGVGWQRRWQVAEVSDSAVLLTLAHRAAGPQAGEWPLAFDATQRLTLAPNSLRVMLTLTNRHSSEAPGGLGLHPYFPRAGEPELQFTASHVWTNGSDSLPAWRMPVQGDWDHSSPRRVGSVALDECFEGWDGQASIATADGPGIVIEADDVFRHLQIYTPPGQDFFCVEPVSHMTDAINRIDRLTDHGLRILGPGATLRGTVTFRLAASG